ncbi:hypothetical protein [Brevibacillus laterosporus]|uniref:Uncharacterized protein n=1 Tax=Brevibacillus laterosporus TaxID=1465 RepID=A0AAP3GCF7_BRELA|nr:hypothetical protein [Brevibacillus laterosporus]MCR8982426.1 hypothetical protein [Brevibacillus laterosporus]MCZ0809582.1 hypothetical protein [Brevibacillus laterosporus]MCZ0828115.1 hypothetical protein [Brevibacillus laterosporus]MCZ0852137.1 hypothetical protein [Brevibacillus laterosporus]
MKKWMMWLLLCLMLIGISTSVYAEAPNSAPSKGIDLIFPDEEEMGYTSPGDQLLYKKFQNSNYKWDTAQRLFQMQGITPKVGDTGEITSTNVLRFFQDINLAIFKFTIFVFQLGFASEGDFLIQAIEKVSDEIRPFKSYVYDNLFWFVSLFLSFIVLVKYAQGRNGEAFKAIFLALITTAAIFIAIDNLSEIMSFGLGLVDGVVLTVLGLVNFSPVQEGGVATSVGHRIVEICNTIFTLNVHQPWMFGEFGSLESPMVTGDESGQVQKIEALQDVKISTGDDWAEVLLSYSPGSEERTELVQVLGDKQLSHDAGFNNSYLWSGAGDRWILLILSFVTNLVDAILFGGTGIIQYIGKILIIVLACVMPFLAVFGFFGKGGHQALLKVLGWFGYAFALKIAAAALVGIPMIVNHFISTAMMKYAVAIAIHCFVSLVGCCLLPFVFTHIAPAIIKGTMQGLIRGSRFADHPRAYMRREATKFMGKSESSVDSVESLRRSRRPRSQNTSRTRYQKEVVNQNNKGSVKKEKQNQNDKNAQNAKRLEREQSHDRSQSNQSPKIMKVRGRMPRSIKGRKGRGK